MASLEMFFSDTSEDEEISSVPVVNRRLKSRSSPLDLNDQMFVKYFRISKEVFLFLLAKVEIKLPMTVRTTSVSPTNKLAAVLRFFAEGGYQKGVGNDIFIGVCQSAISRILSEILPIFEEDICPEAIKFPDSEEEKMRVKRGFFSKTGFPGVIGAVDGTHIRIISPSGSEKQNYLNRKGYYSLNTMIVCDHSMKIRYINAKYPGSCHDSFIWNASDLRASLEDSLDNGQTSSWLIGDAGYPLTSFLITPFKNPDDTQKAAFNTILSKTRIVVERTIGLYKNRFRCVMRKLEYKPKKCIQIINACAALHNLCIEHNVEYDDSMSSYDETLNMEPQQTLDVSANENPDARTLRDELMRNIV